jgi:hypothetical protein
MFSELQNFFTSSERIFKVFSRHSIHSILSFNNLIIIILFIVSFYSKRYI